MEFQKIEKALGGQRLLKAKISNIIDLIHLSNRGITKESLIFLARILRLTIDDLALLLPISKRTIQRYSNKDYFNSKVSEKILEVAKVCTRGIEVFGDKDKFVFWLNRENVSLGNRTPLSLLKSSFGEDMILDELGRIEHGIVA